MYVRFDDYHLRFLLPGPLAIFIIEWRIITLSRARLHDRTELHDHQITPGGALRDYEATGVAAADKPNWAVKWKMPPRSSRLPTQMFPPISSISCVDIASPSSAVWLVSRPNGPGMTEPAVGLSNLVLDGGGVGCHIVSLIGPGTVSGLQRICETGRTETPCCEYD